MRQAIVSVNYDMLKTVLGFPGNVKINRIQTSIHRPQEIQVLLEGEDLPEKCKVQYSWVCVQEIRPLYNEKGFLNWGE